MYRSKNLSGGSRIRRHSGKKFSYRIPIRRDLLVWAVVLVVMAAMAVGDAGQESIGVVGDQSIGLVGIDSNQTEIELDDSIQSISFKKGVSIRDALRFLAAKYHKNIVPSPKVDGLITVTSLYNVTFEEALDSILGSEYEYEENGDLIEVYTRADKSRMTYEIFNLSYISAAEASRLMSPVLSRDGRFEVSTPAETGVPVGESIGSGKNSGDSFANRDVIVIFDYPENIADAKTIIEEVDIRPLQVLIEATILSATLTEGMEFGVDLNLLAGTNLVGTSDVSQQAQDGVAVETTNNQLNVLQQIHGLTNGTPLETAGFATVGGNGLRFGVRSGDMVAYISALESVTDVIIRPCKIGNRKPGPMHD